MLHARTIETARLHSELDAATQQVNTRTSRTSTHRTCIAVDLWGGRVKPHLAATESSCRRRI